MSLEQVQTPPAARQPKTVGESFLLVQQVLMGHSQDPMTWVAKNAVRARQLFDDPKSGLRDLLERGDFNTAVKKLNTLLNT